MTGGKRTPAARSITLQRRTIRADRYRPAPARIGSGVAGPVRIGLTAQ